jgi:hypothetical protein
LDDRGNEIGDGRRCRDWRHQSRPEDRV